MLMLNIGCGDVCFDGWVNIDLDSKAADLNIDVRDGLPYEDNSIDYIYSEHFIEHLTVNEGIYFFEEVFRVLKKGGVMRVATPSLKSVVMQYLSDDWKDQEWIKKHGYEYLQTRAEMINLSFRAWGHKYLYDEEELKRRLIEAGFNCNNIFQKELNDSEFKDFCDKETRQESDLIIEVTK
ncbi:hypothetical protein Halha_2259 [Halobacteroides halobius DSM 5150]|uniref:Methyltransferase type 11 domain-containing protein n=1 Tax=Halobacteroides halobius (strain ATCC 35273 / DSM 5150 / MD-1) TaxID=748449 RepID=L0KDG4_HALHC|nr:methyltransferase domain-containing protein [Halobacteroides halobius]AGB42133.1 hypothetical protein Halha_2259 [Halobacteroides halobius DSM 5150]